MHIIKVATSKTITFSKATDNAHNFFKKKNLKEKEIEIWEIKSIFILYHVWLQVKAIASLKEICSNSEISKF